ncbi:HET-domain-containing protein [Microthyrium microscopicum]|uniref:HET-domain-containing protein n=1 Tax=Microthyrium microscopicum TaxID=703497 RepID=A0A6A6U2K3_9PEZI|nr:HET-domain-containing protein [Microthyrium microscopicum]
MESQNYSAAEVSVPTVLIDETSKSCDSCARLRTLFRYTYSEEGTFTLEKSELFSSACTYHPHLMRNVFPSRLDEESITSIDVTKRPNELLVSFHAYKDGRKWNSAGQYHSRAFLASKQTSDIAMILDPQWIDTSKLKTWKTTCDTQHSHRGDFRLDSFAKVGPILLIDTHSECLVQADSSMSYVALSYVWGRMPFFKTLKRNLDYLLTPNSLTTIESILKIPRTIKHAMAVVKLLEERYLWVDALCIPQDDEETKHTSFRNMAAIYANASLTIVAAQGSDANFGLRGLKRISESRNYWRLATRFDRESQIVRYQNSHIEAHKSIWASRGWTFQEHLLSSRTLVFVGDTVYWRCLGGFWEEPFNDTCNEASTFGEESNYWQYLLGSKTPNYRTDMYKALGCIICGYNSKELTYPEDVSEAFLGLITRLTEIFPAGFLFGMPLEFFDVFILWQPLNVRRRVPSNSKMCLPSWSWFGWQGALDDSSFMRDFDSENIETILDSDRVVEVIPIMQWFNHITPDAEGTPILSSHYRYRKDFYNTHSKVPPFHWRRHEAVHEPIRTLPSDTSSLRRPRWFYTHEDYPTKKFWYPVALPDSNNMRQSPVSGRFISCHTQRTYLFQAEARINSYNRAYSTIRDAAGIWIGMVALHQDHIAGKKERLEKNNCGESEAGSTYETTSSFYNRIELVAISQGCVDNSQRLSGGFNILCEWNEPERPKDTDMYRFYDVMCIEWEGSIAYRRGVGRVLKEAWERQELEWIDLMLG